MANTPIVYVFCDQNCKFEGMTKEQILTAIMQAVETGQIGDVDAGFITTIKTINDKPLKFFVGEQSAYDALTDEQKQNLFAIITNDTTKDGILQALETLQTTAAQHTEAINTHTQAISALQTTTAQHTEAIAAGVRNFEALSDGSFVVGKAESANEAKLLTFGDTYTISTQFSENKLSNAPLEWNTLYTIIVECKRTVSGESYKLPSTCVTQLYIGARPTEEQLDSNACLFYSPVMIMGRVAALYTKFCVYATTMIIEGAEYFVVGLRAVDGDELDNYDCKIKICKTASLAID